MSGLRPFVLLFCFLLRRFVGYAPVLVMLIVYVFPHLALLPFSLALFHLLLSFSFYLLSSFAHCLFLFWARACPYDLKEEGAVV